MTTAAPASDHITRSHQSVRSSPPVTRRTPTHDGHEGTQLLICLQL